MTTLTLASKKSRQLQFYFASVSPILVALLGLLSIVDVLSLHDVIAPMFFLGHFPIDWTVVPAAGVVYWMVSSRTLGFNLNHQRGISLGVFFGISLAIISYFVRSTHSFGDAGAFLILGLKEEAIYRVAVPVSICWLLCLLGIGSKNAMRVSIAAGAVVFMTLPGHVAQTNSRIELLVFGAFALIMSYFVWDTQTILLAGVLHGTINAVTDLVTNGSFSPYARILLVFIMIVALVSALPHSGEDEETPEGEDAVVIDLRDHVLAAERKRHEIDETVAAQNAGPQIGV